MNKQILKTDVQDFIDSYLESDTSKILFKGTSFDQVSTKEIVEQIDAKKKCRKKLSTWFETQNIYFPKKLNIEQTSSEKTALYKSNLISGNSLIDLTGGFGVDSYYFSKRFENITHCEITEELSEIATHNFSRLRVNNIETVANNGITFLQESQRKFDWIYVDPSRRSGIKGKVFLLKDCLPNVPNELKKLFNFSNNILIKVSPILDITSARTELNFVKAIHIVAAENEVKELLFILEKGYDATIDIKTINLLKNGNQVFNFTFGNSVEVSYKLPHKYIYEPNSAILKSGGFNEVANKLNLFKLHQHSHLYTSEKLIDFPGRSFKLLDFVPFNNKTLKNLIPSGKANITTRNFPLTVAQIRKKTKLKDGGNQYLFFTTDINNNHIVLICQKV